MIRINLLPVREERRKAGVRQFGAVLAAAFVGALAVAGFFHWKVSSDVAAAKAALADTQRKIDDFGAQIQKVEEYRKTKAAIEQKLGVIARLEASRSGPVHVLDELATHAPDRLWITKIEAREQSLWLHGMSLDNELVALFLTTLNESPYFRNVELLETEAKDKGGFKLNAFELSATMTSPALEQAASGAMTPAGTGR